MVFESVQARLDEGRRHPQNEQKHVSSLLGFVPELEGCYAFGWFWGLLVESMVQAAL